MAEADDTSGWLLKYPGTFQGDGVEPVEAAYERYRSRWHSVASTNESILSVLQASGASPLTFWASAISTDQPSCSLGGSFRASSKCRAGARREAYPVGTDADACSGARGIGRQENRPRAGSSA
jgi:hypothetical protein